VDRLVGRLRPPDLPLAGPAPGKPAALFEQAQHHLPGARELLEVREHRGDRVGHRLVGRDSHPALVVVLIAGGQRQPQLALGRLVQDPAAQPAAQHVQLGLGHRALEPEHEPIVVQRRVIHAVGVGDQRVGQRAQIQQLVPVGVAPRQPRDLDPEHDPHLAQADVGHQLLEAVPALRARARAAEVRVDHDHLARVPAERDRPLGQLVLALQALGVALDLGERALAHVHVRLAGAVLALDLAHRPASRPLRIRAIAPASRRRTRSRASGPNDSQTASTGLGPSTGRAS
jgi:hypothetical protein